MYKSPLLLLVAKDYLPPALSILFHDMVLIHMTMVSIIHIIGIVFVSLIHYNRQLVSQR